MIWPISKSNYFMKELKKRVKPGTVNMKAAIEYAERSLGAVERMYGDRRNKPVIIVFADHPRSYNSPVPFKMSNGIDYFLVTTRSDGGLDMIASNVENKILLSRWRELTTQFDLSEPVKIINKDDSWKCMDPSATPAPPTTTTTTTTTTSTTTSTPGARKCPYWMEEWDASRKGLILRIRILVFY